MGKCVNNVLAIDKLDEFDKIIVVLNIFNLGVEFTKELESNNNINFLDTIVVRKSNKPKTHCDLKEIATCVMLNYRPQHPFIYKYN